MLRKVKRLFAILRHPELVKARKEKDEVFLVPFNTRGVFMEKSVKNLFKNARCGEDVLGFIPGNLFGIETIGKAKGIGTALFVATRCSLCLKNHAIQALQAGATKKKF